MLFLSLSAVDVSRHFKGIPGRARQRGRGPVDIRSVFCIVLKVLYYTRTAQRVVRITRMTVLRPYRTPYRTVEHLR
ncbi:uncharacterized protein ARMOST_02357 [Armillaria ostoyae]|uniref:Uncharacterized protein n=1 Tax=Armillaria ostoyae TaxID=47428 RepID=A0A284QRH8_ARMOS|nr:uncharacterized protein ARMOST_02357 [Armillaria ostoyae]